MKTVGHTINERKLEPLWSYSLTENEKGLVLEIYGLFAGKPTVKTLLYTGREHAVLLRTDDQPFIVNDIPEQYRDRFASYDEMTVIESDSHRKYSVNVKKATSGLNNVCRGVMSDLVYFPLHPYPMSTGSVIMAKILEVYAPDPKVSVPGRPLCASCREPLKHFYADINPVDKKITRVCPKCLGENEKVSRKLNLYPEFTPSFYVNGNKTPIWGSHCGKDSIYLGSIGKDDLSATLKKEIIENWKTDNNIFMYSDPNEILDKFKGGMMSLHLFRCTDCGRRFALAFEKNREELTDEEWDLIDILIPMLGKEKEWEVSTNRHHKRCLWEREEDAPFVLEEGIRELKKAAEAKIDSLGLPDDKVKLLKDLFNEFS